MPVTSWPPWASSISPWVEGSSRPCCSNWPTISTRLPPIWRSRPTPTGWSLTKARLRPSAPIWRRSSRLPSTPRPCSASRVAAGCPGARSNSAVTLAWAAPRRSSPASARAPRARPRASSRIDLPAPVSPVRTVSPGAKARSRRSMRTMSRMASPNSIAQWSEEVGEPGAALLLRLQILGFQQIVAHLVPAAAGVVVAEHRGGGLRLVVHAQRQVAFGQPLEGLRHMAGGLVLLHHGPEAVDGGEILSAILVPAPDLHLLAREMVAAEVDLERRVAGIGRSGKAVHDLLQGIEGLFRRLLVAPDVLDLLVVAERLQVVGVGGVLVAGMQVDEVIERGQRLAVAVGAVIGIGIHDLGLGRDGRVGVLLLDLLEELCRVADVAGLERCHALVVEGLCRLVGDLVLVDVIAAGTAGQAGEAPQEA